MAGGNCKFVPCDRQTGSPAAEACGAGNEAERTEGGRADAATMPFA